MIYNIFWYLIVIASAVFVYKDSQKYENAKLTSASPLGWAALTFLFWIPSFPIYLIFKIFKYQKKLIDPTYQPNKLIIGLGIALSFAVFIFFVYRFVSPILPHFNI